MQKRVQITDRGPRFCLKYFFLFLVKRFLLTFSPFRTKTKMSGEPLGVPVSLAIFFLCSKRNGFFRTHFPPFRNNNENERRPLITDNPTEIVMEIVEMSSHYIKTPTLIRAYVVYFNLWTIRYSYSELQTMEAYITTMRNIYLHTKLYQHIVEAQFNYIYFVIRVLLWRQWGMKPVYRKWRNPQVL